MRTASIEADQRNWSRPILDKFGPLRADIEREFSRRIERRGEHREGNVYLRELADYWAGAHPLVQQLQNLDDILTRARWLAEHCRKAGVEHTCEAWRLPYPRGSADGRQRRGEDYQYWRRVLRRMVARWWDQFMRLAGFVHKGRQIYCSDQAVKWHIQRTEANQRTLADLLAVSNQGDEIPLDELAESSMANPAHRFVEAMVRIRGVDEWSQARGWVGTMATITCPSRLHARKWNSGALNKKYDGSTPRDSHEYLGRVFARIRAKLAREGIEWKGFRVVEPHHDGCAHWHVLLFCPPGRVREAEEIIRHYAMQESPTEAGARKRRVKFERIDRSKGDAASYVAKYIAKSLDGKGVEADLFGNEGEWAARRVVAWARCWGIRQFAFYAAESVGIYREYRRIQDEAEAPLEPHRATWEACQHYRWREFMDRQGGPLRARLVRHSKPICDRYGDALPDGLKPIIGLEIGPVALPTRIKEWSVVRRPAAAGRALHGAAGAVTRTRVPNCTGPPQ